MSFRLFHALFHHGLSFGFQNCRIDGGHGRDRFDFGITAAASTQTGTRDSKDEQLLYSIHDVTLSVECMTAVILDKGSRPCLFESQTSQIDNNLLGVQSSVNLTNSAPELFLRIGNTYDTQHNASTATIVDTPTIVTPFVLPTSKIICSRNLMATSDVDRVNQL